MKFSPDVRNWTFFASSIISFLVFRSSVSVAQVVVREIVEAMPFTISSSYNGEFKIDSESDFIISGQIFIYFRLYSESFPFIKLIYLISWTKSVCFSRQFILKYRKSNAFHPTIAQLAERETVEAKQLSLGHWFESGWSEIFLFAPLNCM